MVITKPIGILFENGQKLNEVDLEKEILYLKSFTQLCQKWAPLKLKYWVTTNLYNVYNRMF